MIVFPVRLSHLKLVLFLFRSFSVIFRSPYLSFLFCFFGFCINPESCFPKSPCVVLLFSPPPHTPPLKAWGEHRVRSVMLATSQEIPALSVINVPKTMQLTRTPVIILSVFPNHPHHCTRLLLPPARGRVLMKQLKHTGIHFPLLHSHLLPPRVAASKALGMAEYFKGCSENSY